MNRATVRSSVRGELREGCRKRTDWVQVLARTPCLLPICVPTSPPSGALVACPGYAYGQATSFVGAPGRTVALAVVARPAQADQAAAADALEQAITVGGTDDHVDLLVLILTRRSGLGHVVAPENSTRPMGRLQSHSTVMRNAAPPVVGRIPPPQMVPSRVVLHQI